MESYSKVPKNNCYFEGYLFGYTYNVVGDRHPMGKGEIRLQESGRNGYQSIKIVAWYDIADRLREVPEGSWIKVLSSFSENEFAGKTYSQFTASAFSVG